MYHFVTPKSLNGRLTNTADSQNVVCLKLFLFEIKNFKHILVQNLNIFDRLLITISRVAIHTLILFVQNYHYQISNFLSRFLKLENSVLVRLREMIHLTHRDNADAGILNFALTLFI